MRRRLIGQKLLVVGPGWLGAHVAAQAGQEGATVWTLRRTASPPAASLTSSATYTELLGDIREAEASSDVATWMRALPKRLDHLVLAIAPGRRAGDDHRSVYPPAVRGATSLARRLGVRSLLYTSSTGVYGRTDGRWVDEFDALEARDERQRALIEAESLIQRVVTEPVAADQSRFGATILRPAGLYGPARDPAPRFKTPISDAATDGWTNFSWRDDVVEAILHLLAHPTEPGACRVFNCPDGTPLKRSTISRALGAPPLGAPPLGAPPLGAAAPGAAALDPTPRGMTSNQRVSSQRLRDSGWSPSMPTVLHGLAALGHTVDLSVLDNSAPYGPATPMVRAFLVRFAGLSASDRARVTLRYESMRDARAWTEADSVLGSTIERSGREPERDALAGPLMQLVRVTERTDNHADEHDAVDALDPIAEPALAALMALLVKDLLSPATFDTLYAPFRNEIEISG